MKKLLLAATALVASAGIAFAADLPQRQVAPAPMLAPAFTWTGFYVGAHAGYAWGEGKANFDFIPLSIKDDIDGGFGGLQAGYNHQFGQFVLGLEVDGSYGDIGVNNTSFGVFNTSTKIDWMGTVRVRAGYAFDRFLPYVTGGFAWANNEVKTNFPGNLSQDKLHTGWALGAGVEYAFTNNISAKVEYLYMDFGKETYFAGALGGYPGTAFDGHIHTIKAGVNYRF